MSLLPFNGKPGQAKTPEQPTPWNMISEEIGKRVGGDAIAAAAVFHITADGQIKLESIAGNEAVAKTVIALLQPLLDDAQAPPPEPSRIIKPN